MITIKIVEKFSTFMICTYYSEEVIVSHILLFQNSTHFNTNCYQFFLFIATLLHYQVWYPSQLSLFCHPYPLPSGGVGVAILVVVVGVVCVFGTVVLRVDGCVFILSTTIQELPTNVGIIITTNTTRITKLER